MIEPKFLKHTSYDTYKYIHSFIHKKMPEWLFNNFGSLPSSTTFSAISDCIIVEIFDKFACGVITVDISSKESLHHNYYREYHITHRYTKIT